MRIIISDVSVLFDLFHIQGLEGFFSLDFEICTTNYVYNEIVQIEQIQEFEMYMKAKKLIVLKLEPKEEQAVFDFITKRKILSLADKTVLWKAIQLKCPLLTGDDKLRKEAKENGIEVHGTIWVILQLIEKKIVTKIKAVELLEELKIINTRLPVDEIDKLIKKLKL